MPEAIEPTEIDLSASMSEAELSELIEVASTRQMPFPDTEGGRLMDSIAIGTGFDIAMTQHGLLPQVPSIEIEQATPDVDLAAFTKIEAGPPVDTVEPTHNDTFATPATYQTDLDPLSAHHQHY